MKKKSYRKSVYSTRAEWLEHRGIGGSDACAIVGKSNWGDKTTIYDRLVNKKEKVKKANERMVVGTLAEEHIRKLFELYHKEYKVISPPKNKYWLFVRNDYPLITLTPDGLLSSSGKDFDGALEIKDVELRTKEDRDNWENGIIPEQYLYQLIHYFVSVKEIEYICLYASLHYGHYNSSKKEFVLDYVLIKEYWLYRDKCEKIIKYLENKEIDFIENNIAKKIRPKKIIKF